jgi:hypothetical protein
MIVEFVLSRELTLNNMYNNSIKKDSSLFGATTKLKNFVLKISLLF